MVAGPDDWGRGSELDVPKLRATAKGSARGAVQGTKGFANLVDHVAFWMPVLVNTVAIDLDKLLENGRVAASAFDGKTSRVVEMTID